MPRKSPARPIIVQNQTPITKLSEGAGMTAGLELWRYGDKIVLYDRTHDNRFAPDVDTWNSALSLKPEDIQYIKNATQ